MVAIWPSESAAAAAGVINFTLEFLLPVLIMLFAYTSMALTLRIKVAPTPTENVTVSTGEKQRQVRLRRITMNIFKTMAIASITFFICWIWNMVWFLLLNLGYPMEFSSKFYVFTVTAVYINCCINPFIYIFKYKQFQKAVKIVVLRRKERSEDTIATSQNSTAK